MSQALSNRVSPLAGIDAALAPLAWPMMRAALGLILVPHGYFKLFGNDLPNVVNRMVDLGLPGPTQWAWFIAILEFFGGLLLAAGLFTRVVAAMFAVEMAVIALVQAPVWFWGSRGMEYPVLMMVFALGFALRGGGVFSLDYVLNGPSELDA
jgi:putative oxidoreductase